MVVGTGTVAALARAGLLILLFNFLSVRSFALPSTSLSFSTASASLLHLPPPSSSPFVSDSTLASTSSDASANANEDTESDLLVRRSQYTIVQGEVIDTQTRTSVPQGPATDGSGSGFDAPAILWFVFAILVGSFLASCGIRGWRLTTGAAVGLAGALAGWAALINTVSDSGVSDILLTVLILAFFGLCFVFGFTEWGRVTGITLLGIEGGVAFAVRIMILRPGYGLLLGEGNGLYEAMWALVIFCGLAGGGGVIFGKTQRMALLFGCASAGTFLLSLGLDLIVNRQSGMSRGLRVFFDRNSSHLLDLRGDGYAPPLSSQIINGTSLGLTVILATVQHFIFKAPFDRRAPRLMSDEDFTYSVEAGTQGIKSEKQGASVTVQQVSTASEKRVTNSIPNGFWDSFRPRDAIQRDRWWASKR